MAASAASPAMTAQQKMIQQNSDIRGYIAKNCPEITQQIYSNTLSANVPGTVVNVQPRAVGLIKRFIIEVSGSIAQSGAETLTLSTFGPANVFSQVGYVDLSNTTRINTSGWHLNFLSTVRPANNRQIYGAAYTTDTPTGFGNNFTVIKAPASVTTAQPFQMFYEVPLAYSDTDLRGAVFASVLNATQQLQLTVNPNFVVSSTGDATLAVYKSSTAATGLLTPLTITVFQQYYDQLPQANGAALFPAIDVSTVYELKNTALQGLVVGQDFPVPFANQREFLSTMLVIDNAGTLNVGSDVNYFSMTAANAYAFFKVDVPTQALLTRKILGDDFPKGVYYFESRRKPINTLQTGNMQINVNMSAVSAGAVILAAWEAFAYANTITNGASLAAS